MPLINDLMATDPQRTTSYSRTRVSIQYDTNLTAEEVARAIFDGGAGYAYGMMPVSFTAKETKTLRWTAEPRKVRPTSANY